MARFLFRFGFCTPQQWKGNEIQGWDDESSEAFFIEASSHDEALSWGCKVAESFTRSLFRAAGWDREIPSWEDSGFAYWIEKDPEAVFSSDALVAVPEVEHGVMPNFSEGRIV